MLFTDQLKFGHSNVVPNVFICILDMFSETNDKEVTILKRTEKAI